MKGTTFINDRLLAYLLLIVRVLLAWMLIAYGSGKIFGGQFGVTPETLKLPLKEVDLFRLSWYVADHEPFKSFIGISQIIAALLLLWTRTRVIGAFIAVPIWLNILIWDITFMGMDSPFTFRLSFYLLLTILIIWHQKQQVIVALRRLLTPGYMQLNFPLWSYLLLPVFALALELILGIPSAAWNFLKQLVK